MLVVHNDIVRAIDDGHVAALALLDLSSAFDSVDHSTLLSILRTRFSVTEQPLEWFRSYLTVTCFSVIVDQEVLFADHVRRLASLCFYWLRQLRSIRRILTSETTTILVYALVIIRID